MFLEERCEDLGVDCGPVAHLAVLDLCAALLAFGGVRSVGELTQWLHEELPARARELQKAVAGAKGTFADAPVCSCLRRPRRRPGTEQPARRRVWQEFATFWRTRANVAAPHLINRSFACVPATAGVRPTLTRRAAESMARGPGRIETTSRPWELGKAPNRPRRKSLRRSPPAAMERVTEGGVQRRRRLDRPHGPRAHARRSS
jgi:hypothetical protein